MTEEETISEIVRELMRQRDVGSVAFKLLNEWRVSKKFAAGATVTEEMNREFDDLIALKMGYRS